MPCSSARSSARRTSSGRRRPRHDQRVDGLGAMARMGTCDSSDRLASTLGRRAEILGVKTNVELGEVEAEELDTTPQRGEPPVRDAIRTAGTKAPVENVEIGRERRRRRVARPVAVERVAQALPGEAELAPVRLVEVAILERGGIRGKLLLVSGDRGDELGRGRRRAESRSRSPARAREPRPHSVVRASVRAWSRASAIVSGPAEGLPSRSPPIQVPKRNGAGASGSSLR